MNIALLDDHQLVRIGVATTLRNTKHTITISVATADELFDALHQGKPCDILLLDILLPGMNGIEVAKRMRNEYPKIKIIVLSVDSREYTLIQLLQIGIDGFVSKRGTQDEVVRAIDSVENGVPFYGRDIAILIRDISDAKLNKQNTAALTKRELEIIQACCDGLLGKEIAEKLNISLRAVNSHKTNIFNKLGISSSVELVRFSIEHGII
ncbi:MAG: response regulator transcription factor [Paludibacteraceae bacterium]|nr:response regulator transcription factor [Paludibacteraceae bacterium]MBR2266107.1 response regulator transcription factor [Paludibacteraceae bacterium]